MAEDVLDLPKTGVMIKQMIHCKGSGLLLIK